VLKEANMHDYLWPILAVLVAAGSWLAIRLTMGRERFSRNMSDAFRSIDLRDESEADA
jgi:hypothetical protein